MASSVKTLDKAGVVSAPDLAASPHLVAASHRYSKLRRAAASSPTLAKMLARFSIKDLDLCLHYGLLRYTPPGHKD